MALPEEDKKYTLEDYMNWDEDERIEIINGDAVMMAPPASIHQEISGELFRQIANFLVGKPCKVYSAPYCVRLFEKNGDKPKNVDTVVEPDISIVCDKSKRDKRGCKGAPDMVIEVLSPSTRRHDKLVKLNLYQRAGVREYWIVDPDSKSVSVYLLGEDGKYTFHEEYGEKDIAKVNSLRGCFIELEEVFREE